MSVQPRVELVVTFVLQSSYYNRLATGITPSVGLAPDNLMPLYPIISCLYWMRGEMSLPSWYPLSKRESTLELERGLALALYWVS